MKNKVLNPPLEAAAKSDPALLQVEGQVRESDIAQRAYEIYLRRDAAEGDALDDWLQAERELCQETLVSQRAAAATGTN